MQKEVEEKLARVTNCAAQMLEETFQGFRKQTKESVLEVESYRREVQKASSDLTEFLVSKSSSGEDGKEWAKPYLSMALSYDRMVHNIEGIVNQLTVMVQGGITFSDRAIQEVNDIFQEAMDLLERLPDLIRTENRLLARQMGEKGRAAFKMGNGFSEEHEDRLIHGICVPKSSPIYLGLLESLKGILVHTLEVTGKVASLKANHVSRVEAP
jgi:Na+/phosphate symporter